VIVILDDPTGAMVSIAGDTREALPGETHHLAELADALTRHTGLPVEVRRSNGALAPRTAVVVHVSQLARLAGVAPERLAVVDVPRQAILPTLAAHPTAILVEHHQYWAWEAGEPADAAVHCDVRIGTLLRRETTVTPLGDGRFGRIRVDGPDLPGLLADCLAIEA
jgi:hypothetical protein